LPDFETKSGKAKPINSEIFVKNPAKYVIKQVLGNYFE